MDVERWLAPLVGAIAISSAFLLVGVYAWGGSLPEEYTASVVAQVPGDPAAVFAQIADPTARATWAPGVARIGRVDDDALGRPVWRELDRTDDRFEFTVVADTFPTFVTTTAKPEEIGVAATWTWTVAPGPAGTEISLREDGTISNPLFRGFWGLRYGPYQQIEEDLRAMSKHLGGSGQLLRD